MIWYGIVYYLPVDVFCIVASQQFKNPRLNWKSFLYIIYNLVILNKFNTINEITLIFGMHRIDILLINRKFITSHRPPDMGEHLAGYHALRSKKNDNFSACNEWFNRFVNITIKFIQ